MLNKSSLRIKQKNVLRKEKEKEKDKRKDRNFRLQV